MSPTHEPLNRFVQEFMNGEYMECIRLIPELDPGTPPTFRLMGFLCALHCGVHETVEHVAREWDRLEFGSPFIRKLSEWLLGRISFEDLVAAAGDDDEERCEAFFFAGEDAVASGDLDAAIEYLRRCAQFPVGTYAKQIAEKHLPQITNIATIRAFWERDYRRAKEAALRGGQMLVEGVALSLLSMQRLGEIGTRGDPPLVVEQPTAWHGAMLQLVRGESTLEHALSLAGSPEEACWARFCHGARLRTLLRGDQARAVLQSCVKVQVECIAADLAQAELDSLRPWDATSGPPDDDRASADAVRACYDGFCVSDYWRVVDVARWVPLDTAPRALVLLYLISLQRLKRAPEAEAFRPVYHQRFADPFSKEILEVAIDRAPVDAALRHAGTDAERCAAYFYAAAWQQTSGRSPTRDWISAAVCPPRRPSGASSSSLREHPEHFLARRLLGIRDDTPAPRQECIDAFEREDYGGCLRRGLECLERGLSDPLPLHLTLVALARYGYPQAAEVVGQSALRSNDLDLWNQRLLRLSLGLASFEEVSRYAPDDQGLCAAALYAGARLATTGRPRDAIPLLRQAKEASTETPEWKLARRELARLDVTFAAELERGRVAKPWDPIKVFVSSTFRDMHAEREQLVRFVFPQLRRFCARRRRLLYEVDLRWGVAEEEDSFERCAQEIESSDIFLCMLGERYGGVELPATVPPEAARRRLSPEEQEEFERLYRGGQRQATLEDGKHLQERLRAADLLERAGLAILSSTTAREVHLAFSRPSLRRVFYFRDPALTATVPESLVGDYKAEGDWSRRKLAELKAEIEAPGRSDPVRAYGSGASWSDSTQPPWETPSPGCFVGFDEFGERVRKDLEKMIEMLVPPVNSSSDADEQDWAMETVVQEHLRRNLFAGRAEILNKLKDHIEWNDAPRLACVYGPSGSGKSALLARLVCDLDQRRDLTVIWHFVGATPESSIPPLLLSRLARKLGAEEKEIKDAGRDTAKLRTLVESVLAQAAVEQRVVLILDGLDQLDPAGSATLDWLPQMLPAGARLIVSVIHDVKAATANPEWAYAELTRLVASPEHFHHLGPLLPRDRGEIIRRYFAAFGKSKRSFAPVRKQLKKREEAGLPLYLLLALEELRTTGGNALDINIGHLAENLPNTVEDLFSQVFDRLLDQNRLYPQLVETVLSAVWANHSRGGITEYELNFLAKMICGSAADGAYARVLLALRPYLVERPDDHGNILIRFFHEQLFHAVGVERRFEKTRARIHRTLARSLFSIANPRGIPWKGPSDAADLMYRVPFELLHHLRAAKQLGRAAAVLCDLRFVAAVCRRGQADRLPAAYTETLSTWPERSSTNPFARPAPLPSWLPECTRALVDGCDDLHPDQGTGPLLSLLRGTPQETVPLVVLDLSQGQVVRRLEGHLWDVTAVAMTPDGRRVVSASADGKIRVWDTGSGDCLHVLYGHVKAPASVDLTDDGHFALSVDGSGLLCAWDLWSGRLLDSRETSLRRIYLAGDGRQAVGTSELGWSVLDLQSGSQHGDVALPQCKGGTLARLADRLATWQRGGTVSVWDTRQRVRIADLTDPAQLHEITCAAITPDGERIVTGSTDGILCCWDAAACLLLHAIPTGHDVVSAVAVTPDGSRAVSVGRVGAVCTWSVEEPRCLVRMDTGTPDPSGIALSADGQTAVIAGGAAALRARRFAATGPPRAVPVLPDQQATLALLRSLEGGGAERPASPHRPGRTEDALLQVEVFSQLISSHLEQLMSPDCDVVALAHDVSGAELVARRAARLLRRRRTRWVKSNRSRRAGGRSPLHATMLAHKGIVGSGFRSIAASADGSRVAALPKWASDVQVWDVHSATLRVAVRGLSSRPASVAVTPEGDCVLAGCDDGSLYLLDERTGHHHLEAGPGAISHLRLTADGALAASLSAQGVLRLWDVHGGRCVRDLRTPSGDGSGLALSGDGRIAITTSHRNEHTVWDLQRGVALRNYHHDASFVTVDALALDGGFAVSHNFEELWLWDVVTGSLLDRRSHHGHLKALSEDGAWGLWSKDGNLRLHVLATGELMRQIPTPGWVIGPAVLSASGTVAITGVEDSDVRLDPTSALLAWDLRWGARTDADDRPLVAVRSVRQGTTAYISGATHFSIVDRTGRTLLRRIDTASDAHAHSLICLAASPDGRTIASAGEPRTIDLWDIPAGRRLRTLGREHNFDDAIGHTESVFGLAFSPDGHSLLSASQDCTIRVWNVASGTCRHKLGRRFGASPLQGHWMAVVDVTISPDGRRAVSAGLDGLIHLWNLAHGVSEMCLGQSADDGGIAVNAVAFTMDGRYIVGGLGNRTVHVWSCEDGAEIAVHTGSDVVWSLKCSTPNGRFLCANRDHRAWTLDLLNFDLDLPLVTAGMQWLAAPELEESTQVEEGLPEARPRFGTAEVIPGHAEVEPAFWCPYCGGRSMLDVKALDTIRGIMRGAGLADAESPGLYLPREAWSEPGLMTVCSLCQATVRANPFFAVQRT